MRGNYSRQWLASLVTFVAISCANIYGQATGPDLTVTRTSATSVYAGAYTLVSLTVVNHGTATAPAVNFVYTPYAATPSILPGSLYVVSADIVAHGHSGRGGGITYVKVGYFLNRSTPLTLAPHATVVCKFYVTYPLGTTSESWTVNAGTATQLNLVSHVATATVTSTLPPVPSAPTGVTATKVPTTDGLKVSWTAPSVGGTAISSSTVTATPISGTSTAVLTATVSGATTTATAIGLAPTTTYSITVVSKDLAGASPASVPITFTSPASSKVPGAPVGAHAWWIGNAFAVAFTAPASGDSPIDDYEVSAQSSEGGAPIIVDGGGTGTEIVVPVADPTAQDFTIKVRAHNAAGWGPYTTGFVLPGL